jgi:hypothetical protein
LAIENNDSRAVFRDKYCGWAEVWTVTNLKDAATRGATEARFARTGLPATSAADTAATVPAFSIVSGHDAYY